MSCAPPSRPTPPVHHEHCLVRTFSPNTLTRPQHPVCSCTPSARIMATQHTPRPRPIPNSLRLPLCCCRSDFRLVFGNERRLFSEMHSADGFEFCLLEAQSGLGYTAMRYTYTAHYQHFIPPIFPSTLPVFSAATLWFHVACRGSFAPNRIP